MHCTDKTIEAAEALLHMESPTCLRDARSPGMSATVLLCEPFFLPLIGETSRLGNLLLWRTLCYVKHVLAFSKLLICLSFCMTSPPCDKHICAVNNFSERDCWIEILE